MAGEPFLAAAAEANAEPLTLEVLGGEFALGPGPDAITWLELCASASLRPTSVGGARAFLAVAQSCFTAESWPEFRAAVAEHGVTDHSDLEDLIGEALQKITGRPTTPSSPSDAGSSSTSPASTVPSSEPTPVAEAS